MRPLNSFMYCSREHLIPSVLFLFWEKKLTRSKKVFLSAWSICLGGTPELRLTEGKD